MDDSTRTSAVDAATGSDVDVCEEQEQLAFVQIGAQRRLAGAGLDAVRGKCVS
jgi:hypothetical protein